MISTLLLSSPERSADTFDETRMTRHQIRNHMQTIQIGLHLLEHRLNMHDTDLQAQLIDLRDSLRTTLRVMDSLARVRKDPTPQTSK